MEMTYDYIIIGGGIVGLSVAWSILEKHPGMRIALLEKENDWACHQTGRNSGVIHSGIYYKPGSMKARLCRQGNQRLLRFCGEHGVRHEVCGKVIVATSQEQLPILDSLHQRGLENGLEVEKLSPSAVRELEPHVQCVSGLRVPSTGIVSYAEVCLKLVELIRASGGELIPGSRVVGLRSGAGEVTVETGADTYHARWLVSCCGLQSDRIAKLAGCRPAARIVPFRGEYYELKPGRANLVRGLVYPVPDPRFPFLGVHFTRMIDGSVHAGPNAVLGFKREAYRRTDFNFHDFFDTISYPGFWRLAAKHMGTGLGEFHRSFSKAAFVRSLQALIPEVQADDLVPGTPGVRAQALRFDGSLVDDFLIVTGERSTHVCNAPSPAATASLEIGRMIAASVPELGSRPITR